MTVIELIRWLQEYPADAEVTVRSRGFFGYALPVVAAALVTQTRKTNEGVWMSDPHPASGYQTRTAVTLTLDLCGTLPGD